jgi:hypothetical protein
MLGADREDTPHPESRGGGPHPESSGDAPHPEAMLQSKLVQKLGSYLFQHPDELLRLLRNAALFRFGVPIAALRWATQKGAQGRKGLRDVSLEAVPPGLRVGMSVELMGTPLRVSALLFVEHVQLGPEELRVELRVNEVKLALMGESESPLAALIRSGALDLGKVGNLVAVMPRRPAFLVEAKDDRIVLDLKRLRTFSSTRIQKLIGLVTPLVSVKGVATDAQHLDVQFDVLRGGVSGAVDAWKAILL